MLQFSTHDLKEMQFIFPHGNKTPLFSGLCVTNLLAFIIDRFKVQNAWYQTREPCCDCLLQHDDSTLERDGSLSRPRLDMRRGNGCVKGNSWGLQVAVDHSKAQDMGQSETTLVPFNSSCSANIAQMGNFHVGVHNIKTKSNHMVGSSNIVTFICSLFKLSKSKNCLWISFFYCWKGFYMYFERPNTKFSFTCFNLLL